MRPISTERLRLRPVTAEDTDDLVRILCNDCIKQTFMLPDFPNRAAAEKMADRYRTLSSDPSRFVMGIALDGRLIGLVNEVDKSADTIEIGYVIHPDWQNRGYATEMLKAVLPALHGCGYRTVLAGYFSENTASGRVMEKAGMRRIGRMDTVTYRGRTHQCLYCQSTAPET